MTGVQTCALPISGDSVSKQIPLTRVVIHGYFATVGARLREGRFFEASDQRSESPAVVVNESFAIRNYPGRSPLGQRLKFENLDENGNWYTIVGVVKEIRERGVAEDSRPATYRVHEQADQTNDLPSGILVRTESNLHPSFPRYVRPSGQSTGMSRSHASER